LPVAGCVVLVFTAAAVLLRKVVSDSTGRCAHLLEIVAVELSTKALLPVVLAGPARRGGPSSIGSRLTQRWILATFHPSTTGPSV